MQPQGDLPPRRRAGFPARLRRHAVLFLILMITLAGVLQWRSRTSLPALDVARSNAVLEASKLITEAPQADNHRILRPVTTASVQGLVPFPVTGTESISPHALAVASGENRELPPSNSGSTSPSDTSVADGTNPKAAAGDARDPNTVANVTQTPSHQDHLPPSPRSLRRTASTGNIPADIEDGRPARKGTDALSGMSIQGDIRAREEGNCPFALVTLGVDARQARAQLREIDAAGKGASKVDWYAVGASLRAGWHVLAIDRSGVLLLDPEGNVVRLHGHDMGSVGHNDGPPAGGDSATRRGAH